ncbi:N-acetylmuramic acid 6-phosphate etherase [Pseudobythopirellula maris]|uniref:N-acetylmuramic acid 6-phosphate etherase n=1 Tax=Pseudobythopirellula maris TaxID=2527991 RepID=A0A5C5ZJ68_9BACT|nr:N-acetylmuramic acid 6-phosphate etherase [Pseudobythopirellula maris]TWT87228.1 N-acetylmuramic acid 6-phosphate etherase [Pseudobythopirellula maris]
MLDNLTTEARNPASEQLDGLTPAEFVRLCNAEDAKVADAVAREADAIASAIEVIADRLQRGGRLIYFGAGTSGRLGVLDASECPPTFNSDPNQVIGIIAGGPPALLKAVEGAEDSLTLAGDDLEAVGLGPLDVAVGIATSGRTPYVLHGIQYAKRHGAYTIGLACNEGAELADLADLSITPLVGPEIVSGSTRLKAGTATKLVLNMLSTGAMVQLGKTYGNLMVDLQPTNSKLTARAKRIVSLATGMPASEAEQQLAVCEGEVKTAIIVWQADVSPEKARDYLAKANGHLGRALSLLGAENAPT